MIELPEAVVLAGRRTWQGDAAAKPRSPAPHSTGSVVAFDVAAALRCATPHIGCVAVTLQLVGAPFPMPHSGTARTRHHGSDSTGVPSSSE